MKTDSTDSCNVNMSVHVSCVNKGPHVAHTIDRQHGRNKAEKSQEE